MKGVDFLGQYIARTPRSKQLFERAQRVIPGGVCHRVRYFPPYPFFVQKVEGSRIWDVDGNEYLDLWMGHYALILGHKPAVVQEGLREVVDLGIHWGTVHEYEVRFAELIQQIIPCAEKLIFGVSGTEVTMYAVRLARGFTKRRVVLKVEGGWHGANSDLSWAIHKPFDQPESVGILSEIGQYTVPVVFNDLEGTLATIHRVREDLAGVIIEPVVGSAGFIPADREYLLMLREETRRVGALFILDEIITGFRLGLGGAQEFYGIQPDLVTLGKIAGGGVNLGVIAGRGDVLSLCDATIKSPKGEKVLLGGGTFSCSPLAMVVGCRMVEYLKGHALEIYPRIGRLGEKLREGMEGAFIQNGVLGKTIGIGSLCGSYLPFDSQSVIKSPTQMALQTDVERIDNEFKVRMLNHGVYVMHGGGGISTAHSEEDIDRVIQATAEVAREMKAS
jgi:glutamate-1-semialdehyde 2,1-aminomutase